MLGLINFWKIGRTTSTTARTKLSNMNKQQQQNPTTNNHNNPLTTTT